LRPVGKTLPPKAASADLLLKSAIVMQPNRKFARFSAEAKAITHINMDREAAEQTCRRYDMDWKEAEAEVERARANPGNWPLLMSLLKGGPFHNTAALETQITRLAKPAAGGTYRKR